MRRCRYNLFVHIVLVMMIFSRNDAPICVVEVLDGVESGIVSKTMVIGVDSLYPDIFNGCLGLFFSNKSIR